ncbi:MAG: MmcQ/YjbR family DNA-binding protein [Oscillospiraceae bacterium]|nr:MmcQ/YjbR family DNA-binding protein [Oscillospiraceae bacterium]
MMRDQVFEYVKKKYKASPEHLWMRFPDYAIFRHSDNEKWFALVMTVKKKNLGLAGEDAVEILNVKLPSPLLADLLTQQPGYFRGYHISRGNWVSILLDGSVPFAELCKWIDESYLTTASKATKQKLRSPKEWIIPANPKYYDIEAAFEAADEIDWKQGKGIKQGDTVFMYVAAPVSAILYQCKVTKTDIPFRYNDGKVQMKALMKIKLQKRYPRDRFTFDRLGRDYGIFAVRGPRGIPEDLSEALK